MSVYGTVVNVQVVTLGAILSADAASGSTVVTVVDNVDVHVGATVALIDVDGTTHGTRVVESLAGENTVTFTTATPAALSAGARLDLSPVQKETRASVRVAAGGDPVRCVVAHSLADSVSLVEGVRDDTTAETVLLEKVEDEWQIVQVAGQDTVRRIIGGYIATSEDETAPRMVMLQDDSGGVIQFWCGIDDETPGTLNPNPFGGGNPSVELSSGVTPSAPSQPLFSLFSGTPGGTQITLDADFVSVIGKLVLDSPSTTASGANLYIDPGTGQIYRSTSSMRYKSDVTEADIDTAAILSLVPRRTRRIDEVAKLGDEAPWHLELIAEEVAAAGLDAFVRCDDEGPESIDHQMLAAVGYLAVLREMRAEIDQLKAQVAALTGEGGS